MQHHRIFIDGPAGRLQALYREGAAGRPAVLVCHPHPQFGGTMRNKVVYWMARAFEDLDCTVLRFNFRGVEQSDGVWDAGEGEADDARAALEWLARRWPDSPLWMAGFSFGAYAGLKAARHDSRVSRLFAVAPAVNHWDFSFMQGDDRPLSVVTGIADEVVPYTDVAQKVAEFEHVTFHAIAGAGHFFVHHIPQMTRLMLAMAGDETDVQQQKGRL